MSLKFRDDAKRNTVPNERVTFLFLEWNLKEFKIVKNSSLLVIHY